MIKHYQSTNLRKGRVSIPGMYYSITKCCFNRQSLLIPDRNDWHKSGKIFHILKFSIIHMEIRGIWCPLVFVMMPDHFHLIFQLGRKKTLCEAVEDLTKFIDREYRLRIDDIPKIWQKDFYDQMIRNQKLLQRQIKHTIENPIRQGLVQTTEQWPFVIIR